jgi:hypothetical protein
MTAPRKGARNPKPQDAKKHPEEWESDLNPERLEGQNIGGRKVDELSSRTAADLREFAETLSAFDRAELAQIPIVPPGMRLKQGGVYLGLSEPSPRPITATGDISAGPENLYISKAEIPYDYWNRLLAIFSQLGSDEQQPDHGRKMEPSEE